MLLCPSPFPKKKRGGQVCSNVTSLVIVFHLLGGMTWTVQFRRLVSLPCQCTSSLCFVWAWLFALEKNDCYYLPSIFIWLSAIRLLIFPRTQGSIKWKMMSHWFNKNWRICLLSFKQCSSQNALNGGVITALTAVNYCPIAVKLLNFVAYLHRIQDMNFYENLSTHS
jgi:hypothetical protein